MRYIEKKYPIRFKKIGYYQLKIIYYFFNLSIKKITQYFLSIKKLSIIF